MLTVDKPDSMMTEPISITASMLEPRKSYEIFLRLRHHMGSFYGNGVFKADAAGEIDLKKAAPIRGTYSGARAMGLFEGLLPCEDFRFGNYCKCTPPNPFSYTLELRDDAGNALHSLKLVKRWIHPAVVRQDIEVDDICGTLFKPPGDGPFPTVIDISGGGGGLHEHKGATLASEGFCVLSLAFFQYKTLITDLNELDLDYFKRAIDWLTTLPFTRGEIGIQGVSYGGLLVNMLAVRNPEIIAVCSINGSHAPIAKVKDRGQLLPTAEPAKDTAHFINGLLCTDKVFKYAKLSEGADIRIETAPEKTAFRFVGSLDDMATPTVFCSRLNQQRLKDSGHYVEVDFAPGGHLMDPPFFPAHQIVYAKLFRQSFFNNDCTHY